jgi:hypothetical protein
LRDIRCKKRYSELGNEGLVCGRFRRALQYRFQCNCKFTLKYKIIVSRHKASKIANDSQVMIGNCPKPCAAFLTHGNIIDQTCVQVISSRFSVLLPFCGSKNARKHPDRNIFYLVNSVNWRIQVLEIVDSLRRGRRRCPENDVSSPIYT